MLSLADVRKIAFLARLGITDKEAEQFAKDLGAVLEYFSILERADVSGIEPMTHARVSVEPAREDVQLKRTKEAGARALVDMVPSSQDGYIKVKSIL